MGETIHKRFQLTATKSKAKVITEQEPRFFAEECDIITSNFSDKPKFNLTSRQSHAQTSAEMVEAGRLLLVVGDNTDVPMESSNINHRQIGNFSEKDNILYTNILMQGERKKVRLANFTIEIVSQVIVLSIKEEKEELIIRVHSHSGNFDISVPKSSFISRFQDVLQKEYLQCRINTEIKNAKALFQQYLSSVYESSISTLNVQRHYTYSGWIKMPCQSSYHYMSNLDSYCKSNLTLANISELNLQYVCNLGWQVLNLGSLEVMVPLFLQMHAGVMAKIFEEADLNLQYIFAMVGITGSKKTSVAKQLFCLFGNKGINFTATERAFELYTEQCWDFNVFIDDFSSAFNKEQSGKLENFIRQYCDTTGRSKSIKGGKEIETVNIRCGVTITAETRPTFLKSSSQLRILELRINKNTFDEKVLSEIQYKTKKADFEERPRELEIYLTGFIRFLEQHYWKLVEEFMLFRVSQEAINSERFRQVYRILLCIARTVLKFAVETQFLSIEQADDLFNQWQNIIYQLILYNDQVCAKVEPYKLFLIAISTGIAQRQILIADTREEFKEKADICFGYWESGFLKIDAHRSYNFALTFNKNYGFNSTDNEIWNELLNKNISEGYEQKNHKAKPLKLIKINDSSIKILCLNWSKVQQLINETEE